MAENDPRRRAEQKDTEGADRRTSGERPRRYSAQSGESGRAPRFPKGTPLHAERRARQGGQPGAQQGARYGARPQNAAPQNRARPQQGAPQNARSQNGARPQNGAQSAPRVRANPSTVRSVRSGRAPVARKNGDGVSRRGTYAVTGKSTMRDHAAQIAEWRRERIVAQNERREITERKRNAGIVRTKSGIDIPMLVIILVLLALGTVAVFSASYPAAIAKDLGSTYYVRRQLLFVALGVAALAITSLIPPVVYKRAAPFIFGVTVVLLIAVPIFGIDYQGTKRWLGIPNTGFSIQPSEIMKFAIVLVLAWFLDKYRDRVTDRLNTKKTVLYGFLFPGVFVAVACGLVIIEKHLSATAIIAAIGLTVMLIGGSHVGLTLGGAAAVGGGAFGIYILRNPYALSRVSTKLDEDANVLAEKWQTTQGLYAIGNGGPFGVGLGSSIQKYSYVSEAQNDFIFTIWCEETGFVGAILVILLYLAFIWRGFKIAMHAPDTFSALTVYGLTAHVGIQAFLNMLVVTDNMFNTGVSLPFFSYGGSSLIFLMAEMGILLSISKHSFQKR